MKDNMINVTSISTFLLLEFTNVRDLQIAYFFVFLALYLMAITGNLLIIIAVTLDLHLHTPMFFFLLNLAVMDIGTISVTVPKSMAMSLTNNRSISFSGCVAQVFSYFFCLSSDFFLLIIMALDRYVAICNPLQYGRVMHKGACLQMVATVWIIGLSYAILHTGGTFANTFCSNMVNQFFCEVPQLLKLTCSKTFLVEGGLLILSCIIGLGGFIFIIITYVQIFAAVLSIPSVHGQKKALSTCLPHLVVVSVFIFSAVFAYGKPPSNTSSDLDLAVAVIYAIIPPILNPFIYSMRNKELKAALRKLLF
ncbi:LOW QUALITY PROTEIN: olfactory receptor 14A16-like [Sceloporus undulatus]|uniref:LOW QUALITY PROTEIN: olfactory receptor 14A16-like n=1 Tax=Sceloporus undulatus TaxID=8520 RepID=UPI001C4ACE6D|nr:LOW QUALITY PROTEIN: olfactory receptor 14A16-like [Sceloporus undulatus]